MKKLSSLLTRLGVLIIIFSIVAVCSTATVARADREKLYLAEDIEEDETETWNEEWDEEWTEEEETETWNDEWDNEDTEPEGTVEQPETTQEPEEEIDPNQVWPAEPDIDGHSVILMEANSGAIVYSKNADEIMYPASTTKILTAIVVLENCSLDETVTFTEECCNLEDGAVTIDSVPGEKMSLKDVMYGLLLPSGNDCAMALAIHTAGSINAFVEMMNKKAEEIGCTSSHFSNPSGLFHSKHYTTASDLALIAQYAFRNSTFVDIISHPTYIIEPTNKTPESRVLTNTHEMIIPGMADYNKCVIGGKTGYLYESGRCLVTYAEKDGITFLSVILDGSYYGIFTETQELLDFGYDNFSIVNVSESERRFSYADKRAKVQLDPSSEIISLNNVDFTDLTAKVKYAYYLDGDAYARAKAAAGIAENDPRQLYATIDYSYAGYYLGSCNVFINPETRLSKVAEEEVVYINVWLLIAMIIAVIVIVFLIIHFIRKAISKKNFTAKPGRNAHRRNVRYYDKSDSVDLREQYINSGKRDKGSIHRLRDIGVERDYEDYYEDEVHEITGSRSGSTRSGSSRSGSSRSSSGRSRSSSGNTSRSRSLSQNTSRSSASRNSSRSSSDRNNSNRSSSTRSRSSSSSRNSSSRNEDTGYSRNTRSR